MMRSKMVKKVLFYLLVIAVVGTALLPFYFMLTTALKTSQDSIAYPPQIFPEKVTLEHFKDVLNPEIFPFWRYFFNSFVVAFTTAVIAVIIGGMGAYGLAKLEFPFKKYIQGGTLIVYMFSGILLVVPLFKILSSIGLYDNKIALVLSCLVTTLPATLYMLSSYFTTIPVALEESAMIDGLSRVQVIFRIVLPLSIPAVMSVFAYVFMITWNDFLFAFTFLSDPQNATLSIGLRQLFVSKDYVWGRMMAASLLTAIPVILMFSLVEKFITGGLTAGGVKE